MEQKDMVALVAGASVGFLGGALGAVLASTVGGEALYRFLDQFGDQYFELGQPGVPAAQHDPHQGSLGSTPLTQLASARSLPPSLPPTDRAATSSWQAADRPVTVSATQR